MPRTFGTSNPFCKTFKIETARRNAGCFFFERTPKFPFFGANPPQKKSVSFLSKIIAKQPVFGYTGFGVEGTAIPMPFIVQTFGYNRMASKVLKEVF